jgi:hypothetical protein
VMVGGMVDSLAVLKALEMAVMLAEWMVDC